MAALKLIQALMLEIQNFRKVSRFATFLNSCKSGQKVAIYSDSCNDKL